MWMAREAEKYSANCVRRHRNQRMPRAQAQPKVGSAIIADSIRYLAEQGDSTSALIRCQQMLADSQVQFRPDWAGDGGRCWPRLLLGLWETMSVDDKSHFQKGGPSMKRLAPAVHLVPGHHVFHITCVPPQRSFCSIKRDRGRKLVQERQGS